jgi:hypothetical protein
VHHLTGHPGFRREMAGVLVNLPLLKNEYPLLKLKITYHKKRIKTNQLHLEAKRLKIYFKKTNTNPSPPNY